MQMMMRVVAVLTLIAGAVQAATINVPGDQPTIQAGIDAAVNGDEVVVSPGPFYNESINFNGKAITVRSTGNGYTSINVQFQQFHVVQCVSGESADTILQGFSITNGYATGAYPDDRGGGMYCKDSSPTIIDCSFFGRATFGGGMYNENSSPTIIGCRFSGNTTFGGGMYNENSHPTIENCRFIDSSASVNGGGMYNLNSSPTITSCIFIENKSDADGAGIYNKASSPIITDCIFVGQTANSGSSIYNYNGSNPAITNCFFSGNVANFNGGVMVNNVNCNPTIVNCTFSNNTANLGGGLFNDSSSPATHNSIFWNNSDNGGMDESAQMHTISGTPTVNYSNFMAGWTGSGGNNINTDPLFINADGADNTVGTLDDNLRLLTDSPSIDTGNNAAIPAGVTTDLDGNALIDNGTVDMGAYELPDIVFNDVSDNFGYVASSVASNLRDISVSGTMIALGDEQVSGSIGIPFSFNFYGQEVSEIFVSSNGFIYMYGGRGSRCCNGEVFPGPVALIAGFWSDLDPSASGTVRYEVLGIAPDRELVIGFYDVSYFEGSPSSPDVTFEIILHEGSQNIELQYGDAPINSFDNNLISVGLGNFDGTDGLQIAHGSNVTFSNEGFLMTHPCPFRLAGDLNFDCVNNLLDFALNAQTWLTDCVATPADPFCVPSQGKGTSNFVDGFLMGAPLAMNFTPQLLVDELLVEVADRWLNEVHYALDIEITGINGGFEFHGSDTIALTDTVVFITDLGVAQTIVSWTTDTVTQNVNEVYTVCVTVLLKGEAVGPVRCSQFGPF